MLRIRSFATIGARLRLLCALAVLGALPMLVALPAHGLDLQAHRGGRGLMPENTLAAFAHALAIGVTTLELDIAITADGVPVISHDPQPSPAIARDVDGRWLAGAGPPIRSLTLRQLQAYDVGRLNPDHAYGKAFAAQQSRDGLRIPTLEALFDRVRELGADDVRFNIETKIYPDRPGLTATPEEFVAAILAVVRKAGMTSRVTIQSFDWRTLRLVRRLEPALPTAFLTVQGGNSNNVVDGRWTDGARLAEHASVAHMVHAAGGRVWSPNFNDVDEAALRGAQRLGLQVIPWTVNDVADMRRLIDWGVDGIITDYPDRLRDVMRERGLALPPPVSRRRAP